MINPQTHAITELHTLSMASNPTGIATGPDGNVWFTEQGAGNIAMIQPATHVITELHTPSPDSQPTGITQGSDGNLWFTESHTGAIGMVRFDTPPSPNPPSSGEPTGPGNGGASGSGNADPAGSGTSPAQTTPVPLIIGEHALTVGKGKHKRVIGFELEFSVPIDRSGAANAANYTVVEYHKHGRQTIPQHLRFKARYDPSHNAVKLVLPGKPRFAQGGQIVVQTTSTSGITNLSSAYPAGNLRGSQGQNVVFAVLPGAQTVVA
jgi:hypothetical protein